MGAPACFLISSTSFSLEAPTISSFFLPPCAAPSHQQVVRLHVIIITKPPLAQDAPKILKCSNQRRVCHPDFLFPTSRRVSVGQDVWGHERQRPQRAPEGGCPGEGAPCCRGQGQRSQLLSTGSAPGSTDSSREAEQLLRASQRSAIQSHGDEANGRGETHDVDLEGGHGADASIRSHFLRSPQKFQDQRPGWHEISTYCCY